MESGSRLWGDSGGEEATSQPVFDGDSMGCVKVAGISVGAGIGALIPALTEGSSGAGCGIGFIVRAT